MYQHKSWIVTKWILLCALVLMTLMLLSCSKPNARDLDNHPIAFGDYRGKWIVLNYWATWCQSCYRQIPQLNAFYQANKEDVIVFGVNFDGANKKTLHDFAQQQHIRYPLLLTNPSNYFGIGEITTLPATFIISPKGKLQQGFFGLQTQYQLAAAIAKTPVKTEYNVAANMNHAK